MLASREERSPDIVVYVEDEQAQFIVDAIIKSLMKIELAGKSKPTIVVAPIGPFNSVVAFLGRSGSLLPETVRQCAMLDRDAKDDYLTPLEKSNNHKELAKFQQFEKQIHYLPWTPEVGICELLLSDRARHESGLKVYFDDSRISMDSVPPSALSNLSGKSLRTKAKSMVSTLVNEISSLTLKRPESVREGISDYFVGCLNGTQSGEIKKLFMPIIKL